MVTSLFERQTMAVGNQAMKCLLCGVILVCVLISRVQCGPYYDRHDRVDKNREQDEAFTSQLVMPGVSPQKPDTYLCTFAKMPEQELFIVQFNPMADMDTVHHMLLYGCEEPFDYSESWPCEYHTCRGRGMKILYAWARNAPELNLPEDVGFRVGGRDYSKYLVLQVHYNNVDRFRAGGKDDSGIGLTMTYTPQLYVAGIYLLVSMNINVNPGDEGVHSNVVCHYEDRPKIYAFAYRTHTHTLGTVVSGYRVRNGQWLELGKANPQWPQAFYSMDDIYEIHNGDTLAARCTFSGKDLDHSVHVGSTSHDEMCNFYIMYYMDADGDDIKQSCSKNGDKVHFPADSDIPPFPNEYLQDEMEQHRHDDDHPDYPYMDYYTAYFDDSGEDSAEKAETATAKPQETADKTSKTDGGKIEQDKDSPNDEADNLDDEEKVDEDAKTEVETKPSKSEKNKIDDFHEVKQWPSLDIELGQIASLDIDPNGDVVIFHRAHSSWNVKSFDSTNRYKAVDKGAISVNTIITIDKDTGKVKYQWGKDLFYLPHGLTIDNSGNIWVTDVALHQVFKFPPGGSDSPLLVLGTKFEPGDDDRHFCKPSDVAVEPDTGNFYVSDGYCNTRVVKYSPTGEKLFQWGEPSQRSSTGNSFPPPGQFNLPHGLTLIEELQQICVADRENGRVQCFKKEDGSFVTEYHPAEFGGRVYAIDYNPANGGLLYVVNGQIEKPGSTKAQIIALQLGTGEVLGTWQPDEGFNRPHGIAVSDANNAIYVCELDPQKVWKFEQGENNSSKQEENQSTGGDILNEDGTSQSWGIHSRHRAQMLPTLLVMMLLAVPIILMTIIVVVLRLRAQGKLRVHGLKGLLNGYRSTSHEVNLGSFFNRHKGFSKVNTEDSDHDDNNLSEDSDIDEFTTMNVNRNSQNL